MSGCRLYLTGCRLQQIHHLDDDEAGGVPDGRQAIARLMVGQRNVEHVAFESQRVVGEDFGLDHCGGRSFADTLALRRRGVGRFGRRGVVAGTPRNERPDGHDRHGQARRHRAAHESLPTVRQETRKTMCHSALLPTTFEESSGVRANRAL